MNDQQPLSRRHFIGGTLATAATLAMARPALSADEATKRKIKLGLIGCGSRGNWITEHFKNHGGYEWYAGADYFHEEVDRWGDKVGVDKSRRFSGLSGYKKLLGCGVEAIAIEDVPYFYPEQAKAAVDAGLHVYMAKPIAVDVPGCLSIGDAAKQATQKKLCFLVDYQLPHEQPVIEVATRVREGAIGKLVHIASFGYGWQGWPDPPIGPTIESRLRGEIWLSDTALSGDTIVSYDIHIIDGIIFLLGKRPVSACGLSRTCRPTPHGDRTDCAGVVYQFEDGTIWTHITQAITNNFDITTLSASFYGLQATAHIQYGGKVFVNGREEHYVGACGSLFDQGVIRNIADFHKNITEGHYENATAPRAVDGTLTSILGREAAARRTTLTMAQLLHENKRLKVDLRGLKV